MSNQAISKEEFFKELVNKAEVEITGNKAPGLRPECDKESARVKAIISKHLEPLLELIK
jgi:hypothetical protein